MGWLFDCWDEREHRVDVGFKGPGSPETGISVYILWLSCKGLAVTRSQKGGSNLCCLL